MIEATDLRILRSGAVLAQVFAGLIDAMGVDVANRLQPHGVDDSEGAGEVNNGLKIMAWLLVLRELGITNLLLSQTMPSRFKHQYVFKRLFLSQIQIPPYRALVSQ